MSDKYSRKELHWNVAGKRLRVVKVEPQKVVCTPSLDADTVTLDQKHEFEITKIYILNENNRETGIVICPQHNQAIIVNIERKLRTM